MELPATNAGTLGSRRDFRLPKVQELYLSVCEVILCLSFDFILMLEHSIFLRPPKLAFLFIVQHT